MRTIQFWQKFLKIFRLHWEYHWSYHHPKTSQNVQTMQKVECLRDKARFRVNGRDDTFHEFLVFRPKGSEENTESLFMVDDMTNTYVSIPQNWRLIDSDGAEERGDIVGFWDGKRYLFEGGSNKLIAVVEE